MCLLNNNKILRKIYVNEGLGNKFGLNSDFFSDLSLVCTPAPVGKTVSLVDL